MTPAPAPPLVVVMGVSGTGKSTIGALLAAAVGIPFADADALHPAANIRKMAAGIPLDDDDRWPWLEVVGTTLAEASAAGTGLVIACSALRRSYRDAIRASVPTVRFVHLAGTVDVLAARLQRRPGHFMPGSLLESQLSTLEPLEAIERGIVVDVGAPVGDVVADAVRGLRAA